MSPIRRLALALALSAFAAAPTSAADTKPGSDTPDGEQPLTYDFRARALGGAFDGVGVRRASGPAALLELALKPALKTDGWELALPLRLDHRNTFGEHLDETVAGATLDVTRTSKTLEHGPFAGGKYTWRPAWLDLYQPECGASGTDLCETDRYSNVQWLVGYQLWSKLGDGRNFRAKAKFVKTSYQHDPNYDPAASVVHLAPSSNGEGQVDLSFRHMIGAVGYALRVDAYYRQYDDLLSKNAGTGGTSRSNPVEKLMGAEPRAELQLRTRRLDATAGFGFLAQSDRFDGYYSYTGKHPYADLSAKIAGGLSAEAKVEARLLRFGPNSKAATEDGKRLEDTRYTATGTLRYALDEAWSILAEGNVVKRETNFPDYVPGVYPPTASRPYDIRWDYTTWSLLAGVEWQP
jgi:opacity protein-like surface antigen